MDRGISGTPIMEGSAELANAPKKTPQIEEKLKCVYGALDRLTSSVSQLGERLTSVMRQPLPPAEGKEETQTKEPLVPLAGEIREISELIEVQTRKLADYLDRLEL